MSFLDSILGVFYGKDRPLTLSARIPLGVEGREPPGPPPGLQESRDLCHLDKDLCERYLRLKADFRSQTGHELFETCTYRGPETQAKLFEVGRRGVEGERKLTNCDGTTIKSRHNLYPSRAVDVAVDVDPGPGKTVVWSEHAYAALGPLCQKHSLVWGGSWTIKDFPHIELPRRVA